MSLGEISVTGGGSLADISVQFGSVISFIKPRFENGQITAEVNTSVADAGDFTVSFVVLIFRQMPLCHFALFDYAVR